MTTQDGMISPQGGNRLFAYCHEGMGVGHLRRTITICNRLLREDPAMRCHVATGSPYLSLFDPHPALGWCKLPTITKHTDGSYCPTNAGLRLSPVISVRSRLLQLAVQKFEPNIVLIDKAPVGVCGELKPTLNWIKQHRPATRLVFGMRDIEDEATATIAQWSTLDAEFSLASHYDEIWVYGMRDLYDVGESYQLSTTVRRKLRYMGYICRPAEELAAQATSDEPADVVVTVGGGTDGGVLLDMFLSHTADRLQSQGYRSLVVAGPDLESGLCQSLSQKASRNPSVRWVRSDRHLPTRLRDAKLVVSMGGYNTLCEAVSLRCSLLVIPRVAPRFEQYIRAKLWGARGALDMIDPVALTANELTQRVMQRLLDPIRVEANAIDLNGLERVCERIRELTGSERKRTHETAVPVQ